MVEQDYIDLTLLLLVEKVQEVLVVEEMVVILEEHQVRPMELMGLITQVEVEEVLLVFLEFLEQVDQVLSSLLTQPHKYLKTSDEHTQG